MSKAKMNEPLSGNASAPAQATAPTQATAPQVERLPTQVTVKIISLRASSSTLATAAIDLNGVFAVRGVKLVQGANGPFVSMPSYKTGDGYRDVCFPVTKEFREQLNAAVLDAYQQEMAQLTQRGQTPPSQEPPAPEMTM